MLRGWSSGHIPGDAMQEPSECPCLSAYGHYRILLPHVVQDQLSEAQMIYDIIQEEFSERVVCHPYAQLAVTFWAEFQTGQDVAAVCGMAADYAATHAEPILTPLGDGFYGFAYPPKVICSFR